MTASPPLSAEDWPTESERRYAKRQARFATECGLDVESRTIETDAVGRIHYLAAGAADGEPVVLLHGITEPAAIWLPMMPALADQYRLYAPDMPGEGLSTKPSYRGRNLRSFMSAYLVEFFDKLGIDRATVVAHSMGGWQAFFLALDHDCVDRLCFVGAPVGASRDFPLLVRLFTVSGINRLLFWLMTRGDGIENARRWVNLFGVVDDSAVPTTFYELYAARQEVPGLQDSLRSLMSEGGSFGRMIPLTDLSEEIIGIEHPTAFVWGSEDYYWEPEVGRTVARRLPDAEFHELPNHGHTPWLEPGDEVETRVRSFLEK
ncbi:MAG: alpha/beta fold hydrolase [Halobacteriales archaeon]